ncbi:hypothetical protein SAMN05216167_11362 [Spirosoma endophyticum]|uniref:Uncharacterized protein n=1 Tax=Spirosoma endophyticum TaxID=662367 RepID=A0A1I2A6A4_9BACT|nr:hypothetical protein SAMN05216167_11362 [Spirosoma endophyticum]
MHKETGVSHGIAKLRFSAFIIHAGAARTVHQTVFISSYP